MQPRAELSFFCSTWNSYCDWESFLTITVFITSEWFITRKITLPDRNLFPGHDRHTCSCHTRSHCPEWTQVFAGTYEKFRTFFVFVLKLQGATQKPMTHKNVCSFSFRLFIWNFIPLTSKIKCAVIIIHLKKAIALEYFTRNVKIEILKTVCKKQIFCCFRKRPWRQNSNAEWSRFPALTSADKYANC